MLIIALVDIVTYGKSGKPGEEADGVATFCSKWLNVRNFALAANTFMLLLLYLFQIKPLRRALRSLLETLLNQTCSCASIEVSPFDTDQCLVYGGNDKGFPRYAYGCPAGGPTADYPDGEPGRNSCLEWATWAGLGPVWAKSTGYHPFNQDVIVALWLAVCLYTLDATMKSYIRLFPKAWRLWQCRLDEGERKCPPFDRCKLFVVDEIQSASSHSSSAYLQQMISSLFLQRGYALTAAVYLIAAFWKTSAVSVWYVLVLTLFIALSHRHKKRLILLRVSMWVVFIIAILEYASILFFNRMPKSGDILDGPSHAPFFPGFLDRQWLVTLYNRDTAKCTKRSEWLSVDVTSSDILAELMVLACTMLQIRARKIYNAYAKRSNTAKAAHLLYNTVKDTDQAPIEQLTKLDSMLNSVTSDSVSSAEPTSPFVGRGLDRMDSWDSRIEGTETQYQTQQFLFPITSSVTNSSKLAECIEVCGLLASLAGRLSLFVRCVVR